MKTLVYDVAASESGALSILEEFYDKYRNDKENQYVFVISTPELESTDNIQVLRYPWIKKSWLHRWWFDHFYAPRIVKEYQIDKVLSLQNVLVPIKNKKIEQTVYLHNALPFAEYRFRFRENRMFWIYQNIIGKKIKQSAKKADKVIVQTNWMKKACVEQTGAEENRIEVQQPVVDQSMIVPFVDTPEHRKKFFYPAMPFEYKNHKVILEACKLLQEEGINNYQVFFTFKGNETNYSKYLYDYVKEYKLNIKFVGKLSRKAVFDMYSKSILVFPSKVETVGIPLLEAKVSRTPIIASCEMYAKEILKNSNCVYINKKAPDIALKKIMKKQILDL